MCPVRFVTYVSGRSFHLVIFQSVDLRFSYYFQPTRVVAWVSAHPCYVAPNSLRAGSRCIWKRVKLIWRAPCRRQERQVRPLAKSDRRALVEAFALYRWASELRWFGRGHRCPGRNAGVCRWTKDNWRWLLRWQFEKFSRC